MRLFFATFNLSRCGSERHSEAPQERAGLLVRPSSGDDRDLHAAKTIDLVVLDLGEHELFLQAERVVAAAVEALVGNALEVADARERNRHELLEEMPHALTAESHLKTDRHPDTQAEVGDGPA